MTRSPRPDFRDSVVQRVGSARRSVQNWSAQLLIRPVSAFALSPTRSFQVPLATSEEALTVYVVTTLSLLPPEPYAFRL